MKRKRESSEKGGIVTSKQNGTQNLMKLREEVFLDACLKGKLNHIRRYILDGVDVDLRCGQMNGTVFHFFLTFNRTSETHMHNREED